MFNRLLLASLIGIAVTGCSGDDSTSTDNVDLPEKNELAIPSTYNFSDADGDSTVSYTGQVKRQVLLSDLTDRIDNFKASDSENGVDVAIELNYYFDFDQVNDNQTPESPLDSESIYVEGGAEYTYGSISSGKNLKGKLAGNDNANHVLGDGFFGWGNIGSPEELVEEYFQEIALLVADSNSPKVISTTDGNVPIDVLYVDEYGRDFKQLTQKFLLGGVNFSQASADYLNRDFSVELTLVEGKAYTTAAHHFDEGFGYFGAARNYADYTDAELAGKDGRAEFQNAYNDANGDGLIDITAEYNFGNSINCAKRDYGTAANANPTNFTQDVFDGFLEGRAIIAEASASGELTSERATQLDAAIEKTLVTWEKCIASTVVHYVNDTLADIAAFDGVNFTSIDAYKDYAKHWSEMKGFALGLQFSPRSPFRDGQIDKLNALLVDMGDAPVLADGTQMGVAYEGGVAAYEAKLLEVRAVFQDVYGFDASNVENW